MTICIDKHKRNVNQLEIDRPRNIQLYPICAYPGQTAIANIFKASPPKYTLIPSH